MHVPREFSTKSGCPPILEFSGGRSPSAAIPGWAVAHRSSLHLPKAGISSDEPDFINLEHSRVVEARGLVPICGLRSPFVALDEYIERTGRHIKPSRWCVCALTIVQSQSAELEDIGRRSEAKIEIHAVTKSRHILTVQRPRSS